MTETPRNDRESLLGPLRGDEISPIENQASPIPGPSPASGLLRQDTGFSPDQRRIREDSVGSHIAPDEDYPQSVHDEHPDAGVFHPQGLESNDSTTNLSPTIEQPPELPPKSIRVTSNPIHQKRRSRQHGPPLKRKGRRSLHHSFLDWKFELIAGLLATAILVTEIILLAHYDGKFLFLHWPHDWKINAVFAFLTTFLEAAIAFYVGACIGQLRWHWFRKRQHRLDWLEIMTEARQPPGAMRLLARKGMQRQYASFGALIIVFLLGVSTFTQNVITEIIAPFPLAPARGYVPINTNYTWFDVATTLTVGTQQPLPQMVAAIQNGFYSFSTNQPSFGVAPWTLCPGDTCHFGKYQSLAVCSKCADMSSEVVNPCPSGDCTDDDYYTLKNGIDLSLVATNGALNLTSDTEYPTNSDLSDVVGPLIVRLHALVANGIALNRTGTGASALECAAWWCVQTYSGQVNNGTLDEYLLEEWTDTSEGGRTTYQQDENIRLFPPKCFINNTETDDPSYCTFKAGDGAQVALQNFLAVRNSETPFEPFLTGSGRYFKHPSHYTWNYTSLLAGGLVSASIVKKDILHNIQHGFTKMAEQMTVSIRGELNNDYYKEWSHGPSYWRQQQFHVRWGWLAYPIALVTLSLAFLIGTIIKTRKQEVWKTSILPMIFHAFGGVDHDKFVKLDTIEEMKEASRGQKMSLGEQGGHSEFKAGEMAPVEHGRAHSMVQKFAGGVGEIADAAGRAY